MSNSQQWQPIEAGYPEAGREVLVIVQTPRPCVMLAQPGNETEAAKLACDRLSSVATDVSVHSVTDLGLVE